MTDGILGRNDYQLYKKMLKSMIDGNGFVCLIDVENDSFIVMAKDDQYNNLDLTVDKSYENYSKINIEISKKYISQDYVEEKIKKSSLDYLKSALKEKPEFYQEYKTGKNQWKREKFSLVECDSNGQPSKILYYLKDITYEKREEEKQIHASLIDVFCAEYSTIFKFNVEDDSYDCIRINNRARSLFPKRVENCKTCSELIGNFNLDIIFRNDKEEFSEFLNPKGLIDKLKYKDFIISNFRIKINEELMFYQVKAVPLRTNWNIKEVIVGFACVDDSVRKEVYNRKNAEVILAHERQYKQAITSDVLGMFEYNLTKGEVLKASWGNAKDSQKILFTALDIHKIHDYDEYMKKWTDYFVESKVAVIPDRKEMIKQYHENTRELQYEIWSHDSTGRRMYLRLAFFLTKDNFTEDIMALETLRDITREKVASDRNLYQMDIIEGLADDYDSVHMVDANTDSFHTVRMGKEISDFFKKFLNPNTTYTQAIGYYTQNRVHPEDREYFRRNTVLEHVKEEMAKEQNFSFRYRALINGNVRYFTVKIARLGKNFSADKFIVGFALVDESVRKEMQQKQLLMDALSQAEHANRAKTEFLSNMSHDIRTPMNAIIGFTTIARDNIKDMVKVRDSLNKIKVSSNHLMSLINDVLDMSRIESGRLRIEEKENSLVDIVGGVMTVLKSQIEDRQHNFHIDIDKVKDDRILCDKVRLNQVLVNLLGNAIKFTPKNGNILLKVEQKPSELKAYGKYEFVVKDDGIGMSQSFVEKIYTPFERENNTTVSGIPGTGLGMSITKSIVETMGGSIAVKSKKGEGTEFRVTLEFKVAQTQEKEDFYAQLRGKKVLLVENNKIALERLEAMLISMSLKVDIVENSQNALEYIEHSIDIDESYYAIISEYAIVKDNNYKLVDDVIEKAGEEVKIILLTDYEVDKETISAVLDKVTGVCSKPVFISDLRSKLLNSKSEKDDKKGVMFLDGKKILVVEDNELNQEIAYEILHSAGARVDVAENGAVAINMISRKGCSYYDIVLMDIQMPVMDGYEATRCIRQLEGRAKRKLPIIVMSANVFEDARIKAREAGVTGYITKPINVNNLIRALQQVSS
ncbi:Signal transduction histidine kinase [Acetitomaculum ruminis DSM 5522]|uniref:Stage 0 sporulation protein A homolog n=1 Tax=Acetitomaculum ruminis DSM 5522 TaxID=1120918 RepID=A0A1I0Y2B3_9FIRM|nr:response regulator [Acetitomaculum ruminis]SFB06343.1 Signal transduction histidine kinase [Acetitomaculum ruminis DSM 5522]